VSGRSAVEAKQGNIPARVIGIAEDGRKPAAVRVAPAVTRRVVGTGAAREATAPAAVRGQRLATESVIIAARDTCVRAVAMAWVAGRASRGRRPPSGADVAAEGLDRPGRAADSRASVGVEDVRIWIAGIVTVSAAHPADFAVVESGGLNSEAAGAAIAVLAVAVLDRLGLAKAWLKAAAEAVAPRHSREGAEVVGKVAVVRSVAAVLADARK